MKNKIDNFSTQSDSYKKYRPEYPRDFYESILSYVKEKEQCLDCGCGTGQVTVALSEYFNVVNGIDISKEQIRNAPRRENITYSVGRAENTEFEDESFDFIGVAQALHWFDIDKFLDEAMRLLKEDGLLCLWGYGLVSVNPSIDRQMKNFFNITLEEYWDSERKYITNQYAGIDFPFNEIKPEKEFMIKNHWSRERLEGFLNSWSAVQHYKDDRNENPVDELMREIAPFWKKDAQKKVFFPLFMRLGTKT